MVHATEPYTNVRVQGFEPVRGSPHPSPLWGRVVIQMQAVLTTYFKVFPTVSTPDILLYWMIGESSSRVRYRAALGSLTRPRTCSPTDKKTHKGHHVLYG